MTERKPETATEAVPEHRVGQVWKDRRSKPRSVFLVRRVFSGQRDSTRVEGTLVAGGHEEAYLDPTREMDARSVAKMFPYLLFDPPVPPERTEQ
jgi:hypothetical protein